MSRPMSLILFVALFVSTLSAPTARAQDDSATELAALRRTQTELTREVATLRDNLVLLEARLQDQQKQLAALHEVRAGAPVLPSAQGPSDQYLRAFGDYAAGRYPQAIAGLEAFIQSNPNSDYAGNAQYWLGDCYFAQQQYALAVAELRKGLSNYPAASKTPDALLKMATALQALKLNDQAREALETLRTRYPNSTAAQQVRPQN